MAGNGHDDFAPTEMWRPEEPPAAAHFAGQADTQTLAIRFTGSGSEYFRIWIVNLLLILVTLTLYLPFARARRMAYFQNNTLVGNDPLGFHADPWKMFRGYLVVAVFGVAYWAVTNFVPAFGWLACWCSWPCGPCSGALRCNSGCATPVGAACAWLFWAISRAPTRPCCRSSCLRCCLWCCCRKSEANMPVDKSQIQRVLTLVGVVVVGFVLLMPWLWKRLKAYQHGGYAFTQERADFTATTGQFYKLYFKIFGVGLLVVTGIVTLIAAGAVLFAGMPLSAVSQGVSAHRSATAMFAIFMVVMALYILVPLIVGSYVGSRMQNLLWSNTQSQRLRLHSALRMGPLLRVSLVNWLLIAITLGLYWPFAKVRTARLKLEAMSVEVDGDVDEWVARASPDTQGALGDAAGDFFGIDLGL